MKLNCTTCAGVIIGGELDILVTLRFKFYENNYHFQQMLMRFNCNKAKVDQVSQFLFCPVIFRVVFSVILIFRKFLKTYCKIY